MNTNWRLSLKLWFVSVLLVDIATIGFIAYQDILRLDPAFIISFIVFSSMILSLPVLFIYAIALPIIKKQNCFSYQKLQGLLLLNGILAAIYTIALAILLRNEPGGPYILRYVFVFLTVFASSACSLLINQTLLQEYFLSIYQKEIEE